ncbi:MFS transporter [Occultella glacieicola]|uniref:MFS transporter n=1 Tax=Occultella glacieicola TaxID=2518684 RepID=A0ABY2E3Q6_9MICO|nr:MFS transporter [Occultella glacieicola]TDE94135.1 MFS transporter [Occultella glacieicola]
MTPTPEHTTSLRSMIPGVYLPSLLFEIGVGAMLPLIAVTAIGLGADLATAALVAALLPIGQILADVPAGMLAARFGDRRAMIGSSVVAMGGMATLALAPNLLVIGVGVLLVGATNSVYTLARQSYLTEVIHPLRRARALSTLGGVARIGLFIGPFAGAALVHGGADTANAYWLGVGTSLLAAVVVILAPEVAHERTVAARDAAPRRPMRTVFAEYLPVFRTLGVAVLLVGAVRGARQTVLPLWTEHLGFEPSATALVFGISGAVDMLLFYPAGKVMDRFGRLWVAIPSMLVMGAAMIALTFTEGLVSISIVAMVMGFGNGIGSGILMTLGADTAPPAERAQYLGIWRLFSDSGSASGPLVVSAGTALGSLAAGIATMGALGAVAALALWRWVPRWSEHANRTTRRRAGIL